MFANHTTGPYSASQNCQLAHAPNCSTIVCILNGILILTIEFYFVVPGDLKTLTGGYAWDRELVRALETMGVKARLIRLHSSFPDADHAALADAALRIAAIPDRSVVIIDGLAGGVMDEIISRNCDRLHIISLCHHPLAFESGISDALKQKRLQSEKSVLQSSRAIIVTSTATARLLETVFEVPSAKITVALPGTSKQAFARCAGEPPVLLTVATLIPRKAHDVLLEALNRIRDLPWQARFVGGTHFDPSWTTRILKLRQSLELEKRVVLTGGLEDISQEYLNADIFVLPSRFEGYGMVFAEALSFGLPIVAAATGAVPDVVPTEAGVLIPSDDDEALAAALQKLLTDREHFAKLRQGAQNSARQLPEWSDTARTVFLLLQQMEAHA